MGRVGRERARGSWSREGRVGTLQVAGQITKQGTERVRMTLLSSWTVEGHGCPWMGGPRAEWVWEAGWAFDHRNVLVTQWRT